MQNFINVKKSYGISNSENSCHARCKAWSTVTNFYEQFFCITEFRQCSFAGMLAWFSEYNTDCRSMMLQHDECFIQTLIRRSLYIFERLLHVRNGNCKYHLGEETFKLAQSYMDKLAKHGQQANKAALYGELCALLFAKSHYDEVSRTSFFLLSFWTLVMKSARTFHDWLTVHVILLVSVPYLS